MEKKWNIWKIGFFVALYIFCICCAELMGAKTFPLMNIFGYHLNASVGIFFIPIIYSVNDVINEIYGPKVTRSLVRTWIFIIVLILLSSILFTWLPPSTRFAVTDPSYKAIFGVSIRISLASLIAFGIGDFLDVYLFSKIRKMFGNKRLWLRNNLSNIISEWIDTIIFMTIAFYSIWLGFHSNLTFLMSIVIPYWILKCCASFIETPFVYLGVHWLRKKDKEK